MARSAPAAPSFTDADIGPGPLEKQNGQAASQALCPPSRLPAYIVFFLNFCREQPTTRQAVFHLSFILCQAHHYTVVQSRPRTPSSSSLTTPLPSCFRFSGSPLVHCPVSTTQQKFGAGDDGGAMGPTKQAQGGGSCEPRGRAGSPVVPSPEQAATMLCRRCPGAGRLLSGYRRVWVVFHFCCACFQRNALF